MVTATDCTVREIVVVLVTLPDIPVMVAVTVPVVAVPLAVNVNVLVLVALAGLKEAVTPLGRPEADKLTLPLKPFCGVMVTVLVPLVPCKIVRLLGDAESVKFVPGAGFTASDMVVVLVMLPDIPVMVAVNVPIVAVPLAVNVNVLVLVALAGLKEAVTPLGRPEADKLTLPLKPFCGVMVTVLVPLVPCGTVTMPGDASSRKLGALEELGQLFTRLVALTVPMPVAKSHPVVVPYAGL